MVPRTALRIILIIAVAGILFSGYLSYEELTQKDCRLCKRPGNDGILGLPACVYGLFMYLAVFTFSLLGLMYKGPEAK